MRSHLSLDYKHNIRTRQCNGLLCDARRKRPSYVQAKRMCADRKGELWNAEGQAHAVINVIAYTAIMVNEPPADWIGRGCQLTFRQNNIHGDEHEILWHYKPL